MLFSAIESCSHSRWRTGDCVKILRGHSNDVTCMAVLANGLLASGAQNGISVMASVIIAIAMLDMKGLTVVMGKGSGMCQAII